MVSHSSTWESPILLNFADRTRSGGARMVWTLLRKIPKFLQFKLSVKKLSPKKPRLNGPSRCIERWCIPTAPCNNRGCPHETTFSLTTIYISHLTSWKKDEMKKKKRDFAILILELKYCRERSNDQTPRQTHPQYPETKRRSNFLKNIFVGEAWKEEK